MDSSDKQEDFEQYELGRRAAHRGSVQAAIQRILESLLVAAFLGMATLGGTLWGRTSDNANSVIRITNDVARLADYIVKVEDYLTVVKDRQREIELELREARTKIRGNGD